MQNKCVRQCSSAAGTSKMKELDVRQLKDKERMKYEHMGVVNIDMNGTLQDARETLITGEKCFVSHLRCGNLLTLCMDREQTLWYILAYCLWFIFIILAISPLRMILFAMFLPFYLSRFLFLTKDLKLINPKVEKDIVLKNVQKKSITIKVIDAEGLSHW